MKYLDAEPCVRQPFILQSAGAPAARRREAAGRRVTSVSERTDLVLQAMHKYRLHDRDAEDRFIPPAKVIAADNDEGVRAELRDGSSGGSDLNSFNRAK